MNILETTIKAKELFSGFELCRLQEQETQKLIDRLENKKITIAVIGQFKRGKTTLINTILGEKLLPVGIVPITAVIIIPIVYGIFGAQGLDWLWRAAGGWWGAAIIGIASVVMLLRHMQNVKRIIKGKEMRFSYVWMNEEDRKKELIRIGKLEEHQELTEKFDAKA